MENTNGNKGNKMKITAAVKEFFKKAAIRTGLYLF